MLVSGYIDAHCHLADSRFDGLRDGVLARAKDAGVTAFLQGGVDPEDWRRQLSLARPGWLPCFGLHPWFVARVGEEACETALAILPDFLPKAFALGELGLDFGPRTNAASHARQRTFFERQLLLAKEWQLPLVLHVVRAHGAVLDILSNLGSDWRGLVHGFSGSYEVAERYIQFGLTLSIGGALTRPGFKKLKKTIRRVAMAHLVVESDAPDALPAGFGRALNEPASIHLVAQAMGGYKQLSTDQVLAASRRNLCNIFRLESNREF